MSDFLLAIRSGFGFLSTIPVGITMEGLEEFFKRTYLHIPIGVVLGLIIGAVAFVLQSFLSPQLCAAFIIVFVYYLTGLNHLDGIADMGDGMTAHGSREKKLKALKDMSLGIGGVAYAILLLLTFYAALVSLLSCGYDLPFGNGWMIFISMIVAEVSAMQSMLTIAAFGKPVHEGLGSFQMKHTTIPKYLAGLVMGVLACMMAFWHAGMFIIGVMAFFASIISALLLINISNRHFGGVNGDIIGASNEIGRVVALLFIFCALRYAGELTWTL